MALVLLHHPLRHHAGAGVFVTERVSTWRSLYCSRVSSICRWCFFSLTVMCAFLPAVCDRSFLPAGGMGDRGIAPARGAGCTFPRCLPSPRRRRGGVPPLPRGLSSFRRYGNFHSISRWKKETMPVSGLDVSWDALAEQDTGQGRVIGRPMTPSLSPSARSAPAGCPPCGPRLRRTPRITGAPP